MDGGGEVERGHSSKRSFLLASPKSQIKICDIVPERFKPEKMFLITLSLPLCEVAKLLEFIHAKGCVREG